MANYTPIINYGAKDSLSPGDPNKAVKGSQLDSELQAIASSIASKQDSAGPAQVTIARNKTSTTSKTTITTPALDPHLQYNVPGAGTYTFDFWFNFTSSSAGGFICTTPFSGTYDSSLSYASSIGRWNNTGTFGLSLPLPNTFASAGSGTTDFVIIKGVLVATSAGTFGLSWAQSTSSASPTTMASGYLLMTKVS